MLVKYLWKTFWKMNNEGFFNKNNKPHKDLWKFVYLLIKIEVLENISLNESFYTSDLVLMYSSIGKFVSKNT